MQTDLASDRSFIALPQSRDQFIRFLQRHARVWMPLALMAVDISSLFIANQLGIGLRSLLGTTSHIVYSPEYLLLIFFFVLIFYRAGLYSPLGHSEVDEIYRLTNTSTMGFVIIGAMSYFLKAHVEYSRLAFGFTWFFAIALLPLGRFIVRRIGTTLGVWGVPVLVIGNRDEAIKVVKFFNSFPKIGLHPVGVFTPLNRVEGWTEHLHASRQHLTEFCGENNVRIGLVVCASLGDLERVRDEYRDVFERIILVNGGDNGMQLSGVTVHGFGAMTALVVRQNLLDPWAQRFKRVVDFVCASLMLLIISPLMAIVSLAIKLDDPGRIFYRQTRVGRDGKHFTLYKFRTMHLNADAVLTSYLEKDPDLKREFQMYQKLRNDPRITRVGKLLRRFSIDELPQLWNVAKGDMSMVGPRPIMINQVELYGQRLDHYKRVTPGITGIWQVSGRNKVSFERRTEFDVQYVMNWSIWLDLYLLARTVWMVIRSDGAS